MKRLKAIFSGTRIVVCLAAMSAAERASAIVLASDSASDSAYAFEADGAWKGQYASNDIHQAGQNPPGTDNGGIGFGIWDFTGPKRVDGGFQDPVPPYGMRGDGIRQMIDRRARQAGLPGAIGVHIFRRTMAHSFLAAGGSEIDLQTIGGWKDRGMVQHYSRALEADRARAAHRRFSPVDALLKR